MEFTSQPSELHVLYFYIDTNPFEAKKMLAKRIENYVYQTDFTEHSFFDNKNQMLELYFLIDQDPSLAKEKIASILSPQLPYSPTRPFSPPRLDSPVLVPSPSDSPVRVDCEWHEDSVPNFGEEEEESSSSSSLSSSDQSSSDRSDVVCSSGYKETGYGIGVGNRYYSYYPATPSPPGSPAKRYFEYPQNEEYNGEKEIWKRIRLNEDGN